MLVGGVRRVFFIIGIVAEVNVVSVITDETYYGMLHLISNARMQTNLGLVGRNKGKGS